MRIVVVGTGGVGALFGGRLAQAGEDVVFLARGATLRALRQDGLQVASIDGDFHLPRVHATDSPAEVGPADAVLVAVKAWQVLDVARQLRQLLGPATLVVPLQNGVEAADQLAAEAGWEHVLGGFCRVIAQQVAPARYQHTGVAPSVAFGALHGTPAGDVAALQAAFRRAGITVEEPADLLLALWEKFLFVSPFGTVGAAARAPIGELLRLPETHGLLAACLAEVVAVSVAQGVALSDASVARVWQLYAQTPAGGTSSMQRDLLAGRPSELEAQPGAVVRLGRRYGVPTPVHDVLYAALRAQEDAARRPTGPTAPVKHCELVMDAPPAHAVAAPPGVRVETVRQPPLDFYRYLNRAVGQDLGWTDRQVMPDADLTTLLADPAVDVHVLYAAGVPVGYAELDRRRPDEVELTYFGLVPTARGRGYGRYFLNWTLHRAWSHGPTRVRLDTNERDHPNALPTYRKAGFAVAGERMA